VRKEDEGGSGGEMETWWTNFAEGDKWVVGPDGVVVGSYLIEVSYLRIF
jgi:hypothetical protein